MIVSVKLSDLKPMFGDKSHNLESQDFNDLYKDVYRNGYDYQKVVIRITSDYYVIDGNHRVLILTDILGNNNEILVDKWNVSRQTYITLLRGVCIVLSPFNKTCRQIVSTLKRLKE